MMSTIKLQSRCTYLLLSYLLSSLNVPFFISGNHSYIQDFYRQCTNIV